MLGLLSMRVFGIVAGAEYECEEDPFGGAGTCDSSNPPTLPTAVWWGLGVVAAILGLCVLVGVVRTQRIEKVARLQRQTQDKATLERHRAEREQLERETPDWARGEGERLIFDLIVSLDPEVDGQGREAEILAWVRTVWHEYELEAEWQEQELKLREWSLAGHIDQQIREASRRGWVERSWQRQGLGWEWQEHERQRRGEPLHLDQEERESERRQWIRKAWERNIWKEYGQEAEWYERERLMSERALIEQPDLNRKRTNE